MKRIPLWIRIAVIGLLVISAIYFCLVIIGRQPASQRRDDIIKLGYDNNVAKKKTEWVDETFRVYVGSKQDPVRIKGRTATYSAVWTKLHEHKDVPVTTFVTENGRVWAGPKEKYYIETKSDVVGIEVNGQFIQWTETMVAGRILKNVNVDEVVKALEKEIQARGIVGMFKYFQGKNVTSFEFFEKYQTDHVSSDEGYFLAKTGNPIHVNGGIARLEIASYFHSTGELWVDINTRKLQKATHNGKLVFTKWWPFGSDKRFQ